MRLSRPVLMSTVVAALAVAIFVINLAGPRHPILLWLPPVGCVAVPILVAIRCARKADFPAPTRRFWRYLACCLVLAGAGAASHGHDAMTAGSTAQNMSLLTVSLYSATMVLLLWSLVRLPLGAAGPGERLRIALDTGTVLIAGALFLWHYQALPTLRVIGYHPETLVGISATLLLELVAVFAIVKVALAGQAYVARTSLRLLAGALAVGVLSSVLQRLVLDRPHLNLVQITLPAIMVCVTAAAERQRRTRMAVGRRERIHKRPFSVLPYLAVAAVDVELLISVRSGGASMTAALAAVGLTGLVVWRQLTVFRQNTELLVRLDHGATHDALTQLPNRALFTDRLAAALADPDPDRRVSVALIDLDDFKIVNDTLGHGVGDALLVSVAERLLACVRPGDTAARLGGDEFVVLLDDIAPSEAEQTVRRILRAFAEPVLAEGHQLLVRASVGIADGRSGDEPGELLRRADIAMYAAKNAGGTGAMRYRPDMTGTVADSATLGAQLQQAMVDGTLFLEYQPIVAIEDGRVEGVEALLRWTDPVRGAVPPAQFIPIAERTGLIVDLGGWVLHEACRQFAAWSQAHGAAAPATLSINVSPRQLSDAAFPGQVAAALLSSGVPARRLVLEITESAALAVGDAAARLDELRSIGVAVALDDFGTGESSLSLLHELPVDQLKLDRSFVQPAAAGRRDTMPAAVLALARATGLDIVAEGVETQEQADRLAALGYRLAQGYHFARPMSAADLDRLVAGDAGCRAMSAP